MKNPTAFISYARRDDAAYGGRITGLRQRLQGLVASAIGRDFEIFQDRQGIAWGQHWPTRLDEALEEALFLIPILTPSYFSSDACRAELEAFLELERRSGRKDRILSLYFLNAPVYEKKADPLAAILQQRQHRDWRHLRIDPLGSPKVMRALDSLAKELAAAIYARQADVSPLAAAPQPSAGGAAIQHSAPTAQQGAATEQAPAAPVERSRMARNYLSALPKRVEQLQIEAERRRLAENQRSREIEEITELVSRTLADLVKTFSSEGAKIVFTDCPFPPNIFSPEYFQMKLYIDQKDYWSLHFVDREIDKIGLMLVRMTTNDSGQNVLTNDSIVFRWVGSDRYSFSLNSKISAEVRANVFRDLDTKVHPIFQAKQDLEDLMLNLFKYELARKSSVSYRDVDAPWCPELVVIRAGSFVMGSPDNEKGRDSNEGPQHRVTFAQPFALGRYPVTFEEYDHFCIEKGREKPLDQGWGRGRRPVINVSWDDARAYCAWLSEQTGQAYRLPSEAEWEYACRAGTTTPFWTGVTISTDQANYNGNEIYGTGRKGKFREKTTTVHRFDPNPWGLHDMHGNVWEWCEDWWHDSYKGAPEDGSAWLKGGSAGRVVRGGSWHTKPWNIRAASRRDRIDPSSHRGFRVARTV